MRAVVHHERSLRVVGAELRVHELDDVPDRLDVNDHAASEHDEIRPSFHDERLGRLDVDRVGEVSPGHEVVHGGPLGPRVMGDVVLECTTGLSAQMASLC